MTPVRANIVGPPDVATKYQGFHRRLPFLGLVSGPRQLRDVIAGVLESDELATARQRDRIIEWSLPTAISHRRPVAASNPAACAHADQSGDTSQPSKPPDRAMPENRPRCGSTKTLATRPRNWRGPGRRLLPCRAGILPADCQDGSRSASPTDPRHAECRFGLRSSRHAGPRNRRASILRGHRDIRGG
jgi:hypothetical protein